MAVLVAEAIEASAHCAIEAPSGLGKTWAYLLPAMLKAKKVIISTAGHYLQEQLLKKDIPQVAAAMSLKPSVALLKGRHNYLCPYFIKQRATALGRSHKAIVKQRQLTHVLQQYRESGVGDIKAYQLEGSISNDLSCAAEECLGKLCPDYKICPLVLARKHAEQADIVIINHSLLLSYESSGSDSPLDNADAVIVDEAHSLFDFALQIAGSRISSRQLRAFIKRMRQTASRAAQEDASIQRYLKQVEAWFNGLAKQLQAAQGLADEQHKVFVSQFIGIFQQLSQWFEVAKERDFALKQLAIQCHEILATLKHIQTAEGLCWVQQVGRGFVIQNIPVHLLDRLQKLLSQRQHQAWVLTSATLSTALESDNEARQLLIRKLGFSASQFFQLDPPFDYQQQARLYLPAMQCNPSQAGFIAEFAELLAQFLAAVTGRVLVLFSSYQAIAEVSQSLRTPRELLIQSNDGHRSSDNYALREQFIAKPQSVLLATGSFWEGVDLSGAALSAVVIDKLPFSLPTDPLVKMRSQYLQGHGVDSFEEYILPEAILRFRQGCGRLLRREGDKGVIMLADSRVQTKDYGHLFLNSLHQIPRCDGLQELTAFIEHKD